MKYKSVSLPKYKELAKYLNVSEQAIKQYNKQKRLLLLLGLKEKQRLDNE